MENIDVIKTLDYLIEDIISKKIDVTTTKGKAELIESLSKLKSTFVVKEVIKDLDIKEINYV